MVKKRRKRNDRNHVLYQITTSTGHTYIGLTVAQGRGFLKSVKTRLNKHLSAAKCDAKDWKLSNYIRKYPNSVYTYEVLEVVRGRKAAHQRERELIAAYTPKLNTK